MKIKFNTKSNTVAVYCILVFAACLFLVALVFKYNTFLYYIHKIIKVLSPIIWGIVFAYIFPLQIVSCPVEQVLLRYSLVALKTFWQPVGIVFHNSFHPYIQRKGTVVSHSEQQCAVSHLFAHSVDAFQLFPRLVERELFYCF